MGKYKVMHCITIVSVLIVALCILFFEETVFAKVSDEKMQSSEDKTQSSLKRGSSWYIGKAEDITDEERDKRKREDILLYWKEKNYRKIPINASNYLSFRYLYGGTNLYFEEAYTGQRKGMSSQYSGGGLAFGLAFEAPIITTRMELEYLYRSVESSLTEDDILDATMLVPVSITGSIQTILFNIYIDFPVVPYVVPYFSTGIGTSAVKLNLKTSRLTIYPSDTFMKIMPTYQASVGVYTKLYSFIYIDIALRYTNIGIVASEEKWSYIYSIQNSMVEGLLSMRFIF